MSDPRTETADLLADRPEIEPDLREMLAVDADRDGWEFQDVPMDSGDFGEVVSRGIVEKAGGEYRIADREAVAAALDDPNDLETGTGTVVDAESRDPPAQSRRFPSVPSFLATDPRTGLAVTGALALLAAVRLVPLPSVLRGNDTVLYPNDPYFYRYWVERTTEAASGPIDVGAFVSLPDTVRTGEPLFVATMGWLSEVVGGGAGGSGTVLAWYPVLAGVCTGALVYLFSKRAFDDRRVAIAAVVLLAIVPMHAFRTGFGFGDHHAFDYVWLGITVVGLFGTVPIERTLSDRSTWQSVVVLGVGVAGQALAWEAGPLLTVPVGAVVLLTAVSCLRTDSSPLTAGLPVIAGLGLGAAVVWPLHLGLGWHTAVVSTAPSLLFLGACLVTGVAQFAYRRGFSPQRTLAAEVAIGALGVVAVALTLPATLTLFVERVQGFLFTSGIVETRSLGAGGSGALVGPLLHFGLVFVIAIPYLIWASVRSVRSHRPLWLSLSTYAWFFLLLSLFQVRFAGQLALFLSPFAGLALVHVTAWVDVARTPRPFATDTGSEGDSSRALELPAPRTAAYVLVFWLILATPGLAVSLGNVSSATISEERHDAVESIREYIDGRRFEFPENYVLSEWSYNRMYNYFVNGDARDFGYALRQYPRLFTATAPAEWFRGHDDRVGFVVIDRDDRADDPESVVGLLNGDAENRSTRLPALGHYRLLHRNDGVLVYRLIEGARIRGQANDGETVTISTTVAVGDRELTYRRQVTVEDGGNFSIRVPYPGSYDIGGTAVSVTEDAVENGSAVEVPG